MAGELGTMPYDVKTSLFPEGTDPNDEAAFYPLLLDTNYRESGYVAAFWVLLVEALFGFLAWRSWRRLTGDRDHPAVKRARGWGDLAVTSAEVERELETAVKAKVGGWTLTQNYAVKREMLSFDLFRLENLVWSYKKVVKRRMYGVIPMGTIHAVIRKRAVCLCRAMTDPRRVLNPWPSSAMHFGWNISARTNLR